MSLTWFEPIAEKHWLACFLLETFVQQDRFRGTCYQAANWIHVGQTTGRTRQDRHNRVNAPFKGIYLYPLTHDVQRQLCR
jgi:hypothetical protein